MIKKVKNLTLEELSDLCHNRACVDCPLNEKICYIGDERNSSIYQLLAHLENNYFETEVENDKPENDNNILDNMENRQIKKVVMMPMGRLLNLGAIIVLDNNVRIPLSSERAFSLIQLYNTVFSVKEGDTISVDALEGTYIRFKETEDKYYIKHIIDNKTLVIYKSNL